MNLELKIKNLQRRENLALYRWTAGRSRIANNYVYLDRLRLNVILVEGGRVRFVSAAPVLYNAFSRSRIVMAASGICHVIEGQRKGCNVFVDWLLDSEKANDVDFTCDMVINDPQNVPAWIGNKILSMGTAPAQYSSAHIVAPSLYRMAREPENLKPVISNELIAALGIPKKSSAQEIRDAFRKRLELFGTFTDCGYVIDVEYVSSGGCVVASARGLMPRAGSVVFVMPATQFLKEADERHWRI